MGLTITDVQAIDVRFPTSKTLDGSDAMNPAPDYSAAIALLRVTDSAHQGHGFTFTIGRGNELCVAGIQALAPLVIGRSLDGITGDMATFWRSLTGESQLRWTGPEKGVIHLAAAAITNAVWDVWAKVEGKPVWQLAADLSPEHFLSLIDLRGLTDVISHTCALDIIKSNEATKQQRVTHLMNEGFPAYTTSAGWLGYPDDKIITLCEQAVSAGWDGLKIKVGRDQADDLRRCALVREIIGPHRKLMVDANQVWEVDEAIAWAKALQPFNPYWIEEPIHPDDILGHQRIAKAVAPTRIASGEHAHNRIMFKQFLQAGAIDVVQLDACRLGGLNEALAVMLLAAHFDKPICPHAGGVGLCENAQHVSMIDYVRVGASLDGRMTEHAAHLHDHFLDPITIKAGRYMAPTQPGFSAQMRAETLASFAFPNGSNWHVDAA